AQFQSDYGALRAALDSFGLTGLPIAIGETGWATAGTNPTNSPGTPNIANALRYFHDYAAQGTASTLFFETFDEPWQAHPPDHRPPPPVLQGLAPPVPAPPLLFQGCPRPLKAHPAPPPALGRAPLRPAHPPPPGSPPAAPCARAVQPAHGDRRVGDAGRDR